MIFRTPSYYNKFRCTAGKCSDNCCIGWEIEVDNDTAEYYRSLSGDFGKRLRNSISDENSFILKNERCPFLNEKNLCDIIINCGENHLCQICRDHPRYFEWYGNIKEGGIGLSCEEGARLILTQRDKSITESEVQEYEEEIDKELFSFLSDAREKIFSVINQKEISLSQRLCAVLDYAERVQLAIDNYLTDADAVIFETAEVQCASLKEALSVFSDFEPIDRAWTSELEALKKYVELSGENPLKIKSCETEEYITGLFEYFIWRYFLKGVFDEEILSKVKLAVVSVLIIKGMTQGSDNLADWIEKSKLYSKQMEYSDVNRESFYDYTYEKQCLSSGRIKGLLLNL